MIASRASLAAGSATLAALLGLVGCVGDAPATIDQTEQASYIGNLGGPLGTGLAAGDTTALSVDPDFHPPCGASIAAQAIYRWTPPAAGSYDFDLVGSSYDTVLALRDFGSRADLGCNDDFFGLISHVSAPLAAGQAVLVVVSGFSANTGFYQLNINAAAASPPRPQPLPPGVHK